MDVVTERLPEAGLVSLHESKAPDPLGALPEIEMRYHQSSRSAVHGFQWLVIELIGDEGLPLHHLVHRKVGCITAVAVGHDIARDRVDLYGREQRIDADAEPLGIELGPLRDAADVDRVRLRGEFLKLVPGPRHR